MRLSSLSGHHRVFPVDGPIAKVGAAKDCDVRLPNGPQHLVELEKAGRNVTLKRLGLWPFPRVHVDGRAVKEAVLDDREAFVVGDFEVSVHVTSEPHAPRAG